MVETGPIGRDHSLIHQICKGTVEVSLGLAASTRPAGEGWQGPS